MLIMTTLIIPMSKIDLGQCAVLPWSNMYELFNYPATSEIDVAGGYKVYNNKVYILVSAKFKANASLTFPKPSQPIEILLYRNGNTESIMFNGEISGNENDLIRTGGVYVYST